MKTIKKFSQRRTIKNTKDFFKKILPKPLLHLYFLLKVFRIKFIKWIPAYDEDELITGHNSDFKDEECFKKNYNLAVSSGLATSGGDKIRWRAHIICWAAAHAKDLDGDFVECGGC